MSIVALVQRRILMPEYSFTVYRLTGAIRGTSFTYNSELYPQGTVTVSETTDSILHDRGGSVYTDPVPLFGGVDLDPETVRDQVIIEDTLTPEYVGRSIATAAHHTVTGSDGSEFVIFRLQVTNATTWNWAQHWASTEPLQEGITYTVAQRAEAGVGGSGGQFVNAGVDAADLAGAVIPCFTRGTVIKTLNGEVPIENLKVGDMVLTMDQGYQPLRWIGSRRVDASELAANPKLYPVQIPKGAMGCHLPERDLLVSRQHRMLVRSPIAQRMFDTQEVLIAAIKLCAMPSIHEDTTVSEVEYFHMLFDDHQVVYANGAPSESLYTGLEAMKALSTEAREEILTLFPELADLDYAPTAARQIPSGKHQKKLLERHAQHEKELVAL